MEVEESLYQQEEMADEKGMLQMVKQGNQYEKTASSIKQSSTDTNDIESDNVSITISLSEREENYRLRQESQDLSKDVQPLNAITMLQKRRHTELQKVTELEEFNTVMILENDPLQIEEITRKLIKVSSQFNAYLDKNVYNGQMVSYAPISLMTPEIEEQKKNFASQYSKNFGSEEINKVFSSQKDVSVIQNDIPERFQLLLGSFIEKQLPEEIMNHLIKWIYSNLFFQHSSNSDKVTIDTIEHILNLILQQKMEILTIWNNEKNFIPNVTLDTLWKIFNLLITYKDEIYYPRSRNDDVIIEMYSIRQISDVVSQYMNIAQNKKEFSDIYLHLNYLKCCFDIKARLNSDIQPNHLKQINQARELNIPQIIYQFFDDSSYCAEMLFPKIVEFNPFYRAYGLKQNSTKQVQSTRILDTVNPLTEEYLLSQIVKNYQQLKQSEKSIISELIQDYICLDFFYNPVIKKFITDCFLKYAVLSTSPHGHVVGFNIYHEHFSAKKIFQKPLSEIKSEEYLTIQQAVQQNLIECRIQLPWQIDKSDDKIFREMYPHFQQQLASNSDGLKLFVTNILQKLLKNYLYPYAQIEMHKILEEKSLNEVRNICVQKFKEYISYGSYMIKDRQDKLSKPETILSCFVNEQTGMVGISMINQDGKEVYKNCLEYYFNLEKLVAQKREQEIKNLYEFIRNRQPYVIIVSSNCTRSLVLKSNLYIQFKNFCRNIVVAEQSIMNCYLHQSSFIQSPRDKYIFLAKKQAKAFQFRLQEICQLWSYENNPILEINFHPFQKKIERRDLQIRFEQVIQERICQDGLEFKQIFDKISPYKDFLQFVPGFGPRKAFFFLSQFEQKNNPKDITSRFKCLQLNLMNDNLIMNSLPFIKFQMSDNPLDQTKIPYNQYFIVKNVVESLEKSQLQQNNELTNPEESEKKCQKTYIDYLKKIIQKPELLSKIDLVDYCKSLEKTYKRQNIIIVIDKILDELKYLSKMDEQLSPISPELTLRQIFESIYPVNPNCLRKGAQLMLKYRDSTDKYIEFTSKDFKIRCRLMKTDIPKGLPLERFFEKKRSAEIELVLDSVKVFDNPSDNNHQIDSIFDNRVSFNYPNYEEIAKTLIPEFMQPNPYFGQLDISDLPSSRIDLKTQFNVFSKEMEKNPHNVIDLTSDRNSLVNQQQQQNLTKSSQWGSTLQNTTDFSSNTTTSSELNSSSGWGSNIASSNSTSESDQPLRQRGDFNSDFKKPNERNNSFRQSTQSSGGFNNNLSTPSWGGDKNNEDQSMRSRPQQQQSWGSTNNDQQDSNKQEGWGSNGNKSTQNTAQGGEGWGSNGNKSPVNSSIGGWATSSNNQEASSNSAGGWGSFSTQNNSNNASGATSNNEGGWGGSTTQKGSSESGGWGASSSNTISNNGGGWGGSSSNTSWGGSNDQGQQSNSGDGGGWNSGEGSGSGWGTTNSSSGFGQNSNRDRNGNGNKGKGCFKCGKEGHMSKDCTEQQQKKGCYKCGQEGHMSRDCTEPQQQGRKSGGGACFKCNQEGHMSRDCPNQQQQKKGCFKCGEEGHMSRECPNPQQQQQKPKGNGCFKCNQEGHMSRDCPNQQQQKKGCFKCGEEGHMSRECPNPQQQQQKPKGNGCFKCGEEGHMSRECPNPQKQQQGSGQKKCFNCNGDGHMSKECPNPKQERKKGCFNCGDEGHQSRECTQERKERPPRNNNRNNSSFGNTNQSFGESSAWGVSNSSGGWGSSNDNQENNSSSGGWGSSSTTQSGANENQTKSNNGGGWGSTNSNTNAWGASSNQTSEDSTNQGGAKSSGWGNGGSGW